jgi:hypothetical protein
MKPKELETRTMRMVYSHDAFSRMDESEDGKFYQRDRFVNHLDAGALATVEKLIRTLVVEERPVILDLMASWDSHIPGEVNPSEVVGLGLNENELARNPDLDWYLIQDLNRDHDLPFNDETFDVVLNTVSVAYLTRPFDVFMEVERILKPGGLFIVVISDRMFPNKAVKIWRQASPEERLLLVGDFFEVAGFNEPTTFASVGKPGIDPVYAVYAEKAGGDPARKRPAPRYFEADSIDPLEIERRKSRVAETLRCPYCNDLMKKWEVPDTPFIQWDNEYVYVCFNDACPYMVEGWDVMRAQGNPGFTYRLMYDPDRNSFKPVPDISLRALQNTVVSPRG